MMESRSYCLACYDKIFHVTSSDAPLVDMNESFDTDAIDMVEKMNLTELDDSDTGQAAESDTDTQTATVSVDELEIDNDDI